MTFDIRFLVLCYLPFCVNPWSPWNLDSSFYQMAISLLASVVLWFLHCFHQIPLALFVLLSSVYGKGSSNFRSKLIYISHKPGICLPSLINYLHWKGWIMKPKLKIMLTFMGWFLNGCIDYFTPYIFFFPPFSFVIVAPWASYYDCEGMAFFTFICQA